MTLPLSPIIKTEELILPLSSIIMREPVSFRIPNFRNLWNYSGFTEFPFGLPKFGLIHSLYLSNSTRDRSREKGMEILFIICSIASSALISAFLSLRLAFLFIASCFISSDGDEFPLLRFYQGSVTHVWRNRRHNPFEYPVCYALLNLDRACSSHSSALPSSLFPRSFFADKLSPDNARALTGTNGPV